MKFLVFGASHRPESYNRMLAKCAASHLSAKNMQVDFAEYGQFDMPVYNDTVPTTAVKHEFSTRGGQCDGIIISSPEYNWSYPGSIKSIIDWTSRLKPNPLKGKTVLLLSASTSPRGGILGLDHLKSPLESIQLFVFPRVFPLGSCAQAFDAEGRLEARQQQNLHALLDEYVTFTQNLTNTR